MTERIVTRRGFLRLASKVAAGSALLATGCEAVIPGFKPGDEIKVTGDSMASKSKCKTACIKYFIVDSGNAIHTQDFRMAGVLGRVEAKEGGVFSRLDGNDATLYIRVRVDEGEVCWFDVNHIDRIKDSPEK